ncbi:MFS transporter [Lysobacter enzymogenes]|nr:MFS transporter [Lysobacter enzymogenes]QCW26915.1 MFS transporter [Lysobacter enzymogenes]
MPAPSPALAGHSRLLTGLLLALFLGALEQTIVATALPAIVRDLAGFDLLGWALSAYLLATAAATPVIGKLSDLHGRRALLRACMALFALGSAICALAPDMRTLIGGRAVQGIGGAGLIVVAQAAVAQLAGPPAQPLRRLFRPGVGRGRADRPAARRRAQRLAALARDLLDQPAAGRAGAVDRRAGTARSARGMARAASIWPPPRCSPSPPAPSCWRCRGAARAIRGCRRRCSPRWRSRWRPARSSSRASAAAPIRCWRRPGCAIRRSARRWPRACCCTASTSRWRC